MPLEMPSGEDAFTSEFMQLVDAWVAANPVKTSALTPATAVAADGLRRFSGPRQRRNVRHDDERTGENNLVAGLGLLDAFMAHDHVHAAWHTAWRDFFGVLLHPYSLPIDKCRFVWHKHTEVTTSVE